nr:hypothetical protein [Tanacetum cinerariifolium]
MGDEHVETIPGMKSDEFIKSSVENLVPIPSESKGESEYDVPVCEAFTTFSNILFDAENNFYSNPHHFIAESDLIESLLNNDSSIIPSLKINSLFDEFAGELTLLKSIPPGIDETDCDPEEESHFIKSLLDILILDESLSNDSLSLPEIESFHFDIPLFFRPPAKPPDDNSIPSGIENVDYDSEGDILFLEELLRNDSLPLPEFESFHFDLYDDPSSPRPSEKSPDDGGILTTIDFPDCEDSRARGFVHRPLDI